MVKVHIAYALVILGLLGFGKIFLSEHDARVQAENNIKSLQAQIKTNDTQAAQKVVTITKIVHDVKTPAQVVSAVPQLTDAPLNTRVAADNPLQVSVDAIPFVNMLAQAKTDSINLAACQADLKSEQQVVVELKKKPKFFTRVKHVAEAVGVGIGIGLFLGGHL